MEANTESDYDHEVDLGDLSLTYGKIAQRIPAGARVLDIGCATGSFGAALQAERSCTVTGIEVDRHAAETARSRGVEVLLADVQAAPLAGIVGGRTFDAIVLADVLEHLLEPRELLLQLPDVLEPGGRVLVSIPNISHVDVQVMLAQDDWRYRSSGLLDRTHIRFFSVGTFTEMASGCGFDIVAMERVVAPFLSTELFAAGLGPTMTPDQAEAIRAAVAATNDNHLTYQHVLHLELAPARAPTVLAEGSAVRVSPPSAPLTGPRHPVVDVVVISEPGRAEYAATLLRTVGDQSFGALEVTVVLQGADETAVREFLEALGSDPVSARPWRVVTGGASRGSALNAGLRLASHDYLAVWSDEDAPSRTFLEQLVEVLEARPWLSAAYGEMRITSGEHGSAGWQPGAQLAVVATAFDRLRLVSTDVVGLSSVLCRVADLRRGGLHFDDVPGGYPEWGFLASLAASWEMELCASATMTTWAHPDRRTPIPGEQSAQHRALVALAAQRDGPLPVRLRRQDARSTVVQLARLTGQLEALEESYRQELLEARDQLNRVLGSRSWRLTRGLRRLTRSRLPR